MINTMQDCVLIYNWWIQIIPFISTNHITATFYCRLGTNTPSCNYTGDCSNDVIAFCCGYFICKSCCNDHKNSCESSGIQKIGIMFDRRDGKLKVQCDEHMTPCSYFCSDGCFICIYCRNRSHRNHCSDTIEHQAARYVFFV